MTDNLRTKTPRWDDGDGQDIVASAIVSPGPPRSFPEAEWGSLYLEIEVNDEYDSDDETVDEYRWTFGISEEDAGFGEAEFEYGEAPDLEQAKSDCWHALIDFLRGEGYADDEIARSVP
jgi:hypothetical protein